MGRRVELEFKPPFILVKSHSFSAVFDKIARYRVVGIFSWSSLILIPAIAAAGLFLLLLSLQALLSRPEIQEAQREAGPQSLLLIPGLNPYLPLLYGWLGLLVALIIHEGAHGALARRLGYKVKSSGLILFAVLPIGAFVETDEEEMKKGRGRDVVRILAGGPTSNILIALLSLGLIVAATSGLQPKTMIMVEEVISNSPAEAAGIQRGDVIASVNGRPVTGLSILAEAINNAGYGGSIVLDVLRSGVGVLRLTVGVAELGAGRPMIGVRLANAEIQQWASDYLERYKSASLANPLIYLLPPTFRNSLHPFSEAQICIDSTAPSPNCFTVSNLYTHPILGNSYPVIANMLYWIWFVNFNVGIFNALPIYPLDGGQIFRRTLSTLFGSRIGEKGVRAATIAVSLALVGLVLSLFMIPYIALLA
ncbi:Putative serine protease HhoA [Candidatus Calditenuaceae archaeon HR02]|nr:Putative serine protease HhoA [Candidatus Calditenuaceae archaeon HR02]